MPNPHGTPPGQAKKHKLHDVVHGKAKAYGVKNRLNVTDGELDDVLQLSHMQTLMTALASNDSKTGNEQLRKALALVGGIAHQVIDQGGNDPLVVATAKAIDTLLAMPG